MKKDSLYNFVYDFTEKKFYQIRHKTKPLTICDLMRL